VFYYVCVSTLILLVGSFDL